MNTDLEHSVAERRLSASVSLNPAFSEIILTKGSDRAGNRARGYTCTILLVPFTPAVVQISYWVQNTQSGNKRKNGGEKIMDHFLLSTNGIPMQ